jgi:hypothetical protein
MARDRRPRIEKAASPTIAEVIPLAEREITLQMFVREKGPLGKAFATSVSLEEGGREVKTTRAQWIVRYNAWLSKSR